MALRLRAALRLDEGEVVAIVAEHEPQRRADALFRLAEDMVEAGGRVITTSTLPLAITDLRRAPAHLSAFEANRARVEAALRAGPHVLITGPVDHTLGRAAGVSPGLIDTLPAIPELAALLVATDAANIPPSATRVLFAHTPASPIPNLRLPVDVILDDEVDASERRPTARLGAEALLREPAIESVLIGNRRQPRAVREVWARASAVVLAAGRSTRMGQSKQLLPWGEGSLIGEVVRRLRATSVHEIVVVTGAEREPVERAVALAAEGDGRVRCAFNPDYATSEMARSLQVGLRALSPRCHAALIALADQPQIEPATVEAVLQRWRETLAPVVAPFHAGQRGHPLLFDRAVWPQLHALPPQANPRAVVQSSEVERVEVESASILQDMDTPEEYERQRSIGSGSAGTDPLR